MNHKGGYMLLCMLVFVLLVPLAAAVRPIGEILDQSTPLGPGCVIYNTHLAQSFRPTLPTLSKIELGLWKDKNITGNFTISIRERRNGADLVSTSVPFDVVSWFGNWTTIDFHNITVTPNKRYYIVYTAEVRNIYWIMSSDNPYRRGLPWSLGGQIPFWLPLVIQVTKNPDLSFRTYGYS